MVRTQVQLTEEQVASLKHLAAEQHVSMAGIIRRAVDLLARTRFVPDDKTRRQKAAAAAGRFHSGCGDLAKEHDRYVAEAFHR
ncbi:ribbon-helix-helix domain-containing protein [Geobacter sp. DSM 9736]|uniref:ribbon-helix-helix domain-containing protein n=1 Tax=Geobacter sp. DSM 9736 TaxID=1277350 RepID=UPI000B508842|nr:ribbon-helix-helix domain-containing protein [Geobacter sp. DSM 9736]SNB46506.1 Ribbon-helix-helix protein, copG family [Geobacter sp. DSM 9736]